MTLFEPKASNGKGILFIHGWRSSKASPERFARALSEDGYFCLTFDLRGHGDDPGIPDDFSRSEFLKGCEVAYDELAQYVSDISVVGASFGGYLASLLSRQRSVSKLVLRVPANYPNDGFDQPQVGLSDLLDRGGVKEIDQHFPDSYAMQALRSFNGPVLIIQSENDQIINEQAINDYVDAASNSQHIVMRDTPHSLETPEQQSEYKTILQAFFSLR